MPIINRKIRIKTDLEKDVFDYSFYIEESK